MSDNYSGREFKSENFTDSVTPADRFRKELVTNFARIASGNTGQLSVKVGYLSIERVDDKIVLSLAAAQYFSEELFLLIEKRPVVTEQHNHYHPTSGQVLEAVGGVVKITPALLKLDEELPGFPGKAQADCYRLVEDGTREKFFKTLANAKKYIAETDAAMAVTDAGLGSYVVYNSSGDVVYERRGS